MKRVLGERILVQRDPMPEESHVLMPHDVKKKPVSGTVLAVGKDVKEVLINDRVWFNEYAGYFFEETRDLVESDLIVMREDEILVAESPEVETTTEQVKMLKNPRIALDLDGVVVNFHQRVIDIYNDRFGAQLTTSDIDGDLESLGTELAKNLISIFNEDGFLLNLEPLDGAIQTVSQFPDLGYHVTVCTAPARNLDGIINPNSAAEKFHWIRKWLPFWSNDVIITKHKELVATDILIDDWAHNIINWCEANPEGIGYIIDQPWNQKLRNYPHNAVRGSLANVASFINKHWCTERGKFVYRLDELQTDCWK